MNAAAPIKLFFAGPVGAGKTSALRCVAEGDIVSTDVDLFDGATLDKSTTTVAIDYSTIRLDDDVTIHLYGIPGQEHFDFMRPIIAEGALGAIVLIDAAARDPIADCQEWVSSLRKINENLILVVGITKTDLATDFSLDAVRASLHSLGGAIPLLRVDPRNAAQCQQLLRVMVALIIEAGA